ncbi:VOC family protein [Nocardia neocaledoniensis]|uniref:VOC family protein n=1 Tax=Nocardia neocaledoniensis TaxID=236511 RepID=UPI002453EBF3|nr:VOC family protein [Nocardia neocaledoniensis]
MTHIDGIHHVGILGRDLDGMERRYRALGFTLTPRSRHLLAAGPGQRPVEGCTANLCAVFDAGYLELLGIVDESAPDPWHTKAMADEYEGLRLLNLETTDAAKAERRLTEAGLRTSGVLDLERPVDTADGPRTLRARAVHVDPRATPETYLGIAQHLTREHVHQPRYLHHPNGARALDAVLFVVADAAFGDVLDRYRRVLDRTPEREGPLTLFRTGPARLEFVRASDAATILPGEPAPAASYPAALTIRVDDVAAARDLVENAAIPTLTTTDGFSVSAAEAYGATLFFTG